MTLRYDSSEWLGGVGGKKKVGQRTGEAEEEKDREEKGTALATNTEEERQTNRQKVSVRPSGLFVILPNPPFRP